MRSFSITLFLFLFPLYLIGQQTATEFTHPDTLRAPTDSFYVHFYNSSSTIGLSVAEDAEQSWGTDGTMGTRMAVYTTTDTLSVAAVNGSTDQHLLIPIIGRRDTILYRLRFNGGASTYFPAEYRARRVGTFSNEVPEVYELASIILQLSTASELTNNRPDTDYRRRVMAYFGHLSDHALIRILDRLAGEDAFGTYYGFRENSYCYRFNEFDQLTYDLPHKRVYYDGVSQLPGGLFQDLVYLTQDFAVQSNFREFFNASQAFYRAQVKAQAKLLPLRRMWDWIEAEFPQRLDHYAVVFSPLTGGTHSTQSFRTRSYDSTYYHECIMFINGPEAILDHKEYTEAQREGLYGGIVFTEIDHNYVNDLTGQHLAEVRKLLNTPAEWASERARSHYGSAFLIFNEYMTHALFCQYVREQYAPEDAKVIVEKRNQLMDRRGFSRFRWFDEQLADLCRDRTRTIAELYPELLKKLAATE